MPSSHRAEPLCVMTSTTGRSWFLALIALAAGCGQEPAANGSSPRVTAQPESRPVAASPAEEPVPADDCPPAGGATDQETAAQAGALVPLKPGLTLSTTWQRATEGDEVECLTQIGAVDGGVIAASATCSMSTGTQGGSRRTCRADLREAYMYYTGAGDDPDVLRGTTMFSLSTRAFDELKSNGSTRHRFVSLLDGAIVGDLDGVLERDANGTLATIVNDRMIELPVVNASGRLRGTAMGKPVETRVAAAIVDDARFPLVLDYRLPDIGSAGFSVRYSKVSYPTDGELEQRLGDDQRIDVYGIYFDVNSDRIRTESEPVLREIADALQRNPQWQLTIEGHTDSIGSERANLELSRQRSEAVRAALVERYGIAAARLSAHGNGATIPKDTNDTPDGRARNRRVELVRR
jgi:outer membrane protein OmpA-like peptidoglycan-associated protein